MFPRKSLLLSLHNIGETLRVSAPTVVDALRGTVSRSVCDQRLESWASRVVTNSEMVVSVLGREYVTPGTTFLVMSNHQSLYDIAVLYYVLGSRLRMVAKRELFSLPVFGKAIEAAGMVPVDRQNKESAIASLEDAKRHLSLGIPIWIAPEGTRSRTGDLLPFKKGGFILALETETPILPVSLRGTKNVLRAKDLRTRHGVEVSVTIHPPIDPRRFRELDRTAARDALIEQVRRAIASGL